MSPPSEPNDVPRCTAKSSRTGERCRNRPMKGTTVCHTHGGLAPQTRAAAERRQQEAVAEAALPQLFWDTDATPVTDPVLALQRFTGRLEVMLDRLGDGINRLEQLDAGSGQPRVELIMWRNVARELRQALEAMTRYGIEDRVTAVLEAQGEEVYELVRAVGASLLAELLQLLADRPGALDVLEAEYERLFAQVAARELGARHELESGGAA